MSQINVPVFTFEDPDGNEEELLIKMNGVEIAHVNHDTHGWAGITAVRDVVDAIEKQLKKEAKQTGK